MIFHVFLPYVVSSARGIRTPIHQGLSLVAIPVCVAHHADAPKAINFSNFKVARQGVEPRLTDSKSVVLSITLASQIYTVVRVRFELTDTGS